MSYAQPIGKPRGPEVDQRTVLLVESPARFVIRPHGEEARALRDTPAMLLMLSARAVSNHEGDPCVSTSPFETHRTVGKGRPGDAPQDEVDRSSLRRVYQPQSLSL
jgi:hypothetical protein